MGVSLELRHPGRGLLPELRVAPALAREDWPPARLWSLLFMGSLQ